MAALPAPAQHEHGNTTTRPAAQILPGMGSHSHPIATSNSEAQRYFNQGLTLVYGFNHEEAVRSFQHAAELDPHAAMPLWGIALALGPNINADVDADGEKAAYEAEQRALVLAKNAPPAEHAYIEALAKRYSVEPGADLKKHALDYANAMRELTRQYPDDLDAATLFAESLMDLNPWKLWTKDGKPAEGTPEIVAVLESVIRRDPHHIGANHYYIHTVEASPNPERALPSANRLAELVPGAGHLVHMPGHIYLQTGDYEAVARSNEQAAEADRRYMQLANAQNTMYGAMYYTHNLHFLMVARSEQGNYSAASRAAGQIEANVAPMVDQMPMVQAFMVMPMMVDLRFHHWDQVLSAREPDSKLALLAALSHFGRAAAFAGKGNVKSAEREEQQFVSAIQNVPTDTPWGVNTAGDVMNLPKLELVARIAEARGDQAGAIEAWKAAVAAQDSIGYDEPSAWYYPMRESLGGLLLRAGRFAEAEAVFRENLKQHPRNPRSLFGLIEAVKAQQKPGLEWLMPEFEAASKHADRKFAVSDL